MKKNVFINTVWYIDVDIMVVDVIMVVDIV